MSGVVSVGVAAVAIGTAVATDFATFAVIAAVGATVGAIGTVAKVPALQIAGAAIGVVGAVGGIASAAGAFGAEGLFGSVNTTQGFTASQALTSASGGQFAESGAQIAATQAAASGGAGAPELGAATWGGGSGFIDQVGGGMTTAAAASSPEIASASAPAISAADGGEGAVNAAGQSGDAVTGTPGLNTPDTPSAAPAPATPLVDTTPPPPVTGTVDPEANLSGFAMGQGPSGPSLSGSGTSNSSVWSGIKDFIKDNKTLVGGAIQAGSSFLSGALSPLTPAQVNALDSQAKANQAAARRSDAEAAILEMQRTNMGQSLPVASRVTGRPALGLVNSAAPITGVPA